MRPVRAEAGATPAPAASFLNGADALDLTAANTYTGGTTIDQGVLELANASAAGSGGIDFASTSGEVEYAAGASLANTISGFGGPDEIDFSTIAYATGDYAVDTSGQVSIENNSANSTVSTFNVSGSYTSGNFNVGPDKSGDILVTYADPPAADPRGAWSPADILAGPGSQSYASAIAETAAASPADLLGSYGSQFAEPPWARGNDLSAFDSWSALASRAGTDPGGFGFHSENDANVGGASDAWGVGVGWAWGVGVGWNRSTGHGPGPN
jgi:autotransporter-associated beta strand protein